MRINIIATCDHVKILPLNHLLSKGNNYIWEMFQSSNISQRYSPASPRKGNSNPRFSLVTGSLQGGCIV